jgi:hypothetical protein
VNNDVQNPTARRERGEMMREETERGEKTAEEMPKIHTQEVDKKQTPF